MPTTAKQRRNRDRATDLITQLDALVPARYPYRAFSKAASESELSLQKRSRNMTLEDVLDAVRGALGKDKLPREKQGDRNVSYREIMCASHSAFAVAVLKDDCGVLEASDGFARMMNTTTCARKRAFVYSGVWSVTKESGVATCQVSPHDVLLCDIQQRAAQKHELPAMPEGHARTLLVFRDPQRLKQWVHEMTPQMPVSPMLPSDTLCSPGHSAFSTFATNTTYHTTASNTRDNTTVNTACNSMMIHADDLACYASQPAGGPVLPGVGLSTRHSENMRNQSMSLPSRPTMVEPGLRGGEVRGQSLLQAELQFVRALKWLEYERSLEAVQSQYDSLREAPDQLASIRQTARAQAVSAAPSGPHKYNGGMEARPLLGVGDRAGVRGRWARNFEDTCGRSEMDGGRGLNDSRGLAGEPPSKRHCGFVQEPAMAGLQLDRCVHSACVHI